MSFGERERTEKPQAPQKSTYNTTKKPLKQQEMTFQEQRVLTERKKGKMEFLRLFL